MPPYVQLLHDTLHRSLIDWRIVGRVTIDMLPDVVLLVLFDFYLDKALVEAWYTLVHVCQKWRSVVFGSPRRLKLRLHCTERTRVKETLDVWPPLPIVIRTLYPQDWGMDNIIAALEHNDRISQLDLIYIPSSQMRKVLEAMKRPFPELTYLRLLLRDESTPVGPAFGSFLGGSAPNLQELFLYRISFSRLPNLLSSATRLVRLSLRDIPHSGYFSPEAIARCLSALTSLEALFIGFKSRRSRPHRSRRHPPPRTRTLLPVLTLLLFKGVCEYLEDLVAQIDAPLLDKFYITFFPQQVFDIPQLMQFLGRTPKFKEARGVTFDRDVSVTLPQISDGTLKLEILPNH